MNKRLALALLGYALLLALLLGFEPALPSLSGVSLFALRSRPQLLALVQSGLLWATWAFVRFVPLGGLSVLVLRDQPDFRTRLWRVAAPALALALFAACLVVSARGRLALYPFRLLLAWLGAALGVWLALSYRRGPRARLLIVPKLVGMLALVLLTGLGVVWLTLEGSPRLAERADLDTAERRELVALFRGKDPRKLEPGAQHTLTVSARQLDQLLAWGARVVLAGRTKVTLREGGVVAEASLPLSRSGRWLNLRASGDIQLSTGEPRLGRLQLRVGKLHVPSPLLALASRALIARVRAQPDGRAIMQALARLSLTPEGATLVYGKVEVPAGLAARLMWGDQRREDMRAAVEAQIERLLQRLAKAPEGDARFTTALTAAFGLARERSAGGGSAVAQNRAALLALGIVLGHAKLMGVLGERLSPQRGALVEGIRQGTTLRSRNDWTRHFSVSAALTVISEVAPSDSMGLLKEELDADGGSGFSFADLLADRSGTMLASLATRDEAHAQRMQERLASGVAVDDVFPSPEGLPEGIADGELQARYGGVGGAGFRQLSEEIERRLAGSSAYGS